MHPGANQLWGNLLRLGNESELFIFLKGEEENQDP